uniref:Uncharacterized protein n=1 Tax=Cacopsylla melanoneura TaxID=428564 RepID=A0A8D8SKK0_9HEMI
MIWKHKNPLPTEGNERKTYMTLKRNIPQNPKTKMMTIFMVLKRNVRLHKGHNGRKEKIYMTSTLKCLRQPKDLLGEIFMTLKHKGPHHTTLTKKESMILKPRFHRIQRTVKNSPASRKAGTVKCIIWKLKNHSRIMWNQILTMMMMRLLLAKIFKMK